ncbi:nischarin [Sinocyclocheilus rhinocerous]|uniref:nischarin n=1 Tax=Sinocyclocheilus rhinocerous TaxID=307959 RepID=UPI0007B88896|nr:PREDICTED: nischarin [Sinocyclocheilus rhinocerous]
MDAPHLPEQSAEKRVRIVGSELVENYTVYIIEVNVGDHRWTVKHRYSDFHDLHEKLTVEKKIDKHLLPPKKIIGKNSKSLVEKRQKELEVYLQTLLSRFPASTPKVLSNFLLFHLYEINGIAAALAEELFHKGEQLLAAGEVFLLRPLQLYAVSQQLKLAKPTCANGDARADLGHILDFTCRLKYLKIPGMKAVVGTSNIEEQSLPFDLSIFKSLLQIEISDCDVGQIKDLPSLKPTLATLSIHLSASSMKEILVPEASEFAQWEPEGVDTDCPVTAIIPTWKMLTTLDMSRNFIRCIDDSVKLIPEVEFLDLSYNELSLVENLQHLYNLVHLDLSFNKLTVLEGVHTKLGNIKTLNLSGNQLETLSGLSKHYSLVNLDLSSNRLAQLDEIKHIGTLPCLEKLSLADNPMCIIPDYRTKVLAQFCDRAYEVCLDGTTTTEKELDTVEVLKAIQKAKEAKDRMANNEKKVSDVPGQAAGRPQSSSSSLVAPPSSSSPSLSRFTCSSQEITTCKEKAFITKEILTPVDSTRTQRCYDVYSSTCDVIPQVETQIDSSLSSEVTFESRLFLNSWDFEESEGSVKGGYLIHFLNLDSSTSDKNVANNPQFPKNSVPSDVLSQISLFESDQDQTSNPMILFLTSRYLCILKVDFVALASRDPTEASMMQSCSKVTRIPLSFTLLDPKQCCLCRAVSNSRLFYDEHVIELMVGHECLTVVFALPQDKFMFLREFTQLRSSLREIKTIALQCTKKGHLKVHSCPAPATATERIPASSVPQEVPRPHLTLSLLYPAKSLIQQLMEDNQCPSHLSLSSSLLLISSLKGDQLVHFFQNNVAEMENEELKHILWTSVLFYRSPDVETTACVLLSTKAIYFILDDTASSLTNQSMMWTWHRSEHKDRDFLISFCFTLKLKDLQSINVGLFDQYFRVMGPSADHIISCLTRDSYSTHRFLQQLMMVLSLLEKVPSPEPSELDFYSQFGNKSTGKMVNYELVHSSKVKFIYPSEEEIGDLTFIVAERKTPQVPSHSFNILLYVLVFQVHIVPGQTAQNQTVLQPKTLILTSTDVFLLDEDHISYPLPEFAKEPPQRDKYCLTDARRIRDLDRVLMGYQTYPQALTLVFDDVPGPDLLCHLTMDHFADGDGKGDRTQGFGGAEGEVQWCIFVPGADSRERLISLLARQWETLCSRELPVELTG